MCIVDGVTILIGRIIILPDHIVSMAVTYCCLPEGGLPFILDFLDDSF